MNAFASNSLSRREHLKQATLGLHRRVENVVDARAYFASRSAYGSWALASLAFHRAAYARVCLDTAAGCLGPTTISERFALLERDIAVLGLSLPPSDEAIAVRRGDPAETLGVLYVLRVRRSVQGFSTPEFASSTWTNLRAQHFSGGRLTIFLRGAASLLRLMPSRVRRSRSIAWCRRVAKHSNSRHAISARRHEARRRHGGSFHVRP